MTKINEIYKCEICGNIVDMVHTGAGELVCCNQPMKLQEEKKEDTGLEKHLPVIEKLENKVIIKVGEVEHPMEEGHHIEWIEVITHDNKSFRKLLKPGEKPEAEFCISLDIKEVREYCDLHGLWKIVL